MTNNNKTLDKIIKAIYNRGYVDGEPLAMYDKPIQMEQAEAKQAILRWVENEVIEPGIKKAIDILPNERNNPHASTRLKSDIKSSQLEILAEYGYKGGE